MKIKIETATLIKALKTAFKVIPTKPTNPVLSCFLFDVKGNRLIITASSLDLTVRIPIKLSSCEEEGICVIPAKKLCDTVSLLSDEEILLHAKDNVLKIEWNKGKTTMPLMNSDEYPSITTPDSTSFTDMPASELLDALSKTLPCCSNDYNHPNICGIYFDIDTSSTKLVASDTKILTYDTIYCSNEKKENFIVPQNAAALLKSVIRKETPMVRLTHDDKFVSFNLGDIIIITRKVVGKFPNYMSIVPQENTMKGTAIIDRENFIGTVKRISSCHNHIKMKFSPLAILISASDTITASNAEEDCDCMYNGEEVEVKANAEHFLSVLGNITSDKISIAVCAHNRPMTVTVEETGREKYLSLIMPII